MHDIFRFTGDFPDWQAGADKRLGFSMVLAAVMLAGMLSLARLPAPGEFGPILELVVELTRPQPVVQPEPDILPLPPVTEIVEESQPATTIPESQSESPPAEEQAAGEGAAIDWDVERDKAIKEVLDAIAREEAYSVNPRFEAARREARVRFRASLAPEVLNAWDNVEKDQLGRTVLRLGDGNCFAILDDPSAVNRWAFETYQRNMVYCDFFFGGPQGKNLPWVEIIRERYPYLRDPVEIP